MSSTSQVVVDLSRYAAAAAGRNTLTATDPDPSPEGQSNTPKESNQR